jgi:hypothetical protein
MARWQKGQSGNPRGRSVPWTPSDGQGDDDDEGARRWRASHRSADQGALLEAYLEGFGYPGCHQWSGGWTIVLRDGTLR